MKSLKIIILRQKTKVSEPYVQSFYYQGNLHIPVTTLLEKLNSNEPLIDAEGNEADYIHFECSCEQGLCGSCSMVINGTPSLACQVFCDNIIDENNTIKIEPLSKFPVICDLIVDRQEMFNTMKEMELWLTSSAKVNPDKVPFQYEVSQCLMCGLCLEACPNYAKGDFFAGAPAAVASIKMIEQEQDLNHKTFIKKIYKKKVFNGCSKALACQNICPMKIPTQIAMSKMNKLSVWKMWQLFSKDK